jgi:hypothetical protein
VDTSRLNMLHDTDDIHIFTITDGIGLGLNCSFQEVIQKHHISRDILQ